MTQMDRSRINLKLVIISIQNYHSRKGFAIKKDAENTHLISISKHSTHRVFISIFKLSSSPDITYIQVVYLFKHL